MIFTKATNDFIKILIRSFKNLPDHAWCLFMQDLIITKKLRHDHNKMSYDRGVWILRSSIHLVRVWLDIAHHKKIMCKILQDLCRHSENWMERKSSYFYIQYIPLNHIIHCVFRLIFTERNKLATMERGKIFTARPKRQRTLKKNPKFKNQVFAWKS